MPDSKNDIKIPFNRASLTGQEGEYVRQAFANGHISGDGPFTRRCQALLEKELGVEKVMLVPSCTQGLEMAALLLDIAPGDEVVAPSFTFVSTLNAFVLRGAQPIFIDIRPDTMNIDERLIERRLSRRTRAIVVVHYAGVGCEMDAILAVAQRHGIPVVEDNAHGLFGKYHGRYLGTFGCLATQSFHETKNITCGEGGALLLNDASYIERAEILREKGTDRSRFFRGQVDKYTWVDIGSSYLLSDVMAAFLLSQLETYPSIQKARRRIWTTYHHRLAEWADSLGVGLPVVPAGCEQSYHMFYLLLRDLRQRQALIAHLREHGILSAFHYMPLHLSPMGRARGGQLGDCPVTEDISDRLVRLPFYNSLSESDQETVVDRVRKFR